MTAYPATREDLTKLEGALKGYAYSLERDHSRAQDLLQNTYEKALKSLHQYEPRPGASLKSWAMAIMRNQFLDSKRRDKKYNGSEETDTLVSRQGTPEQIASANESIKKRLQAIEELPDDHRRVITLCDLEGNSYEEIAEILGVEVGTVRSRLGRARDALAQILNTPADASEVSLPINGKTSRLASLAPSEGNSGNVFEVPVKRVRPMKGQPREFFNPITLEHLARSIAAVGQLVPVLVCPATDDPEHDWELCDGERRWRAIQMVSIKTIRISVVKKTDVHHQFALSAIANFGRDGHTELETARALSYVVKELKWSVLQTAEAFGKSTAWVYQYLSVLKLDPEVQEFMSPKLPTRRRLALSKAMLLVGRPPEHQKRLAKLFTERQMTLGQAKRYLEKEGGTQELTQRKPRGRPTDRYRVVKNSASNLLDQLDLLLALPQLQTEALLKEKSALEREALSTALDAIVTKARRVQQLLK